MALAGYCDLIAHYDLRVPLPDRLAVISTKHKRYEIERQREILAFWRGPV